MGLLDTILGKLANADQSLLFNAGVRGLAQPSVSRYKRGPLEHFGSAWSEGARATSDARNAAMQNDLIREKIAENQRQVAAQKELQDWITKGGSIPGVDPAALQVLFKADPETAAKALAGHLLPPARDPELDLEIAKLKGQGDKDRIANTGAQVANEDMYINADRAEKSLAYLKSLPGGVGDVLVSSPKSATWLRQASNFSKTGLAQYLPDDLRKTLAGVVPEAEWPKVIKSLETIAKTRSVLAAGKATGQQGVAGLDAMYEGFGAGAGIDVNREMFSGARRTASRLAELNSWELPDLTGDQKVDSADVAAAESQGVDVKGEGKPASQVQGYSGTAGKLVPQPEGVQTPLVDPAAAPVRAQALPPVGVPSRKVRTETIVLDPKTGIQVKAKTYANEKVGEDATPYGQPYVAPDPDTNVMTVFISQRPRK